MIKLSAAYEIMAEAKNEIEDIQQIKEFGATIPGQDCKWCTKTCKDRIVQYAPYRVSANTFQDRACILKNNYPRAMEKLIAEINKIIRENESNFSTSLKNLSKSLISNTPQQFSFLTSF